MRSACADLNRWRSRGVGQKAMLRINVSPAQLVSRGFVRSVADILCEFGIDSSSVCLETTERAVVRDIEITRKALQELKEIGVQIAIDDFGKGHAVLSDLESLPVDALKIDTAFVRDLGTSPGSGDRSLDHRAWRGVRTSSGRRGRRNTLHRIDFDAAQLPPGAGVFILAADPEQRHGIFIIRALDVHAVPREQGCIGGGGNLAP
jgi:hypothetical protein